jgi:SRSO17 transposase
LAPSKPIFKQNFPYKRDDQVKNFSKSSSYNSYTSWRRWNKFSSKQYCSNIGKVERCQVVVRADIVVFVDGVTIRFPISVKPYFTKDKASELGDEIGEFKSKIELAKECVEEAMKFFDIDYVVFDSWYTTKEFIRFIEEKGLKWVGQLKYDDSED